MRPSWYGRFDLRSSSEQNLQWQVGCDPPISVFVGGVWGSHDLVLKLKDPTAGGKSSNIQICGGGGAAIKPFATV